MVAVVNCCATALSLTVHPSGSQNLSPTVCGRQRMRSRCKHSSECECVALPVVSSLHCSECLSLFAALGPIAFRLGRFSASLRCLGIRRLRRPSLCRCSTTFSAGCRSRPITRPSSSYRRVLTAPAALCEYSYLPVSRIESLRSAVLCDNSEQSKAH